MSAILVASLCPWCGHPRCLGATRSQPHHGLCCLDGPRRLCWRSASDRDRIEREHRDEMALLRDEVGVERAREWYS